MFCAKELFGLVLKNTPFVPVRYAVVFGTWIDCPNSLPRRGYYNPRSYVFINLTITSSYLSISYPIGLLKKFPSQVF